MNTAATENLLILQGLLDCVEDPQSGIDDPTIKQRILELLRLGGPDSSGLQQGLDELIEFLLQGPHEEAAREVLSAATSAIPENFRGGAPQIVSLDQMLPEPSAVATGLETALSTEIEGQQCDYEVVPVFFATNRAPTGKSQPRHFFSGMRGDLQYGYAEVSIPDRHKRGLLEQPAWYRPLVNKKPQRHVTLLGLTTFADGLFVDHLHRSLAAADVPQTLVFIHGYNVSFESAVRRVAQICYDLPFRGVPILYSWPSTARWYRYTVDETNVESAITDFRDCIQLIRSSLSISEMHMLAHSMGNRLLRNFVEKLDRNPNAARLAEIVMAAPDVDANLFQQTVSNAWQVADHFTLYASSRDWPLCISKWVHGYPRAGESGEKLVIVDGVDTIDASQVHTELFGHSYYGDAPSILSDVFLLLQHRFRPQDRPALKVRNQGKLKYWHYMP